MDKKEYEAPKMEIVEMPLGGRLLQGSSDDNFPVVDGECMGECDDAY